ncbi:glutathione S-transferase family protein [Sandaracinobacteroides hominis]|uniref:glutathione S-transferase family protein n=1 Tax=Sandaracinobacteroides hominis TaxID=2780086 RepID=UPI0018F34D70|nr:glutathione S-transferase family protein [Sandaracinobacteroides hominis]
MQLYGSKGWGSSIIELQLDYYGIAYAFVQSGDVLASQEARAKLAPLNPLSQVPTLVLDSGEVLTESAAITLWLAEQASGEPLAPPPGAPDRAQFLRWLIFIVANIYPCFTYADLPERFVEVDVAQKPFRKAVDAYGEKMWQAVEAAAVGPWFLGERLSAIDVYVAVMSHWRPKQPWFAEHAPKLYAIAQAITADPRFAPALARNFN